MTSIFSSAWNSVKLVVEDDISPLIPGTRAYKSRARRWMASLMRSRARLFLGLTCIEDEVKSDAVAHIRHHLRSLAALRWRMYEYNRAEKIATWLIVLVFEAVFPFAYAYYVGIQHPFIGGLIAFLPHALLTFLLLLAVSGILFVTNDVSVVLPRQIRWGFDFVVRAISAGFLVGAGTWVITFRGRDLVSYIAASPLVAGGGLILGFFSLSIATRLFEFYQNLHERYQHPDSVVVDELLSIITTLDANTNRWGRIDYKRWLASHMDTVSTVIRSGIRNYLNSADGPTNRWVHQMTVEVAECFRIMKIAAYSPGSHTRDELKNEVANALVCTAMGTWNQLRRCTPPDENISNIARRALDVGRTLILAGFPILVLLAVQNSYLMVQPPYLDYAVLGAIFWAALTFLSALDPSLTEKITALRGLAGVVPVFGKPSK